MTTVLVVDDEPQIARALRIYLTARGYDVVAVATGSDAINAMSRAKPDLMILDLGLPDMDGVDVVEAVRGWTTTPIVILSGRAQSQEKVRALEAGADDYVTKPFNVEELLARVRAVGRRAAQASQPIEEIVRFGDVTVDFARHATSRDVAGVAQSIHLTRTEWRLLEVLLRNPGSLITQGQLMREVRGPDYDDVSHYIRQYMAQLRGKLEADPSRPIHLLTEPGMGYRFQPDA